MIETGVDKNAQTKVLWPLTGGARPPVKSPRAWLVASKAGASKAAI